MWDWLFGPVGECPVTTGYQQYCAEIQQMSCTIHCDICMCPIKIGHQKLCYGSTLCGPCRTKLAPIIDRAIDGTRCCNPVPDRHEYYEAQLKGKDATIGDLKNHVARLQAMISKMMN